MYRGRVNQSTSAVSRTPNACAMVCVESGDNEEAKDYLIEALRLFPDDPWSLVVLANQYAKEDDQETAAKFVRRALELKPGDPWALNTLATALMEQGKLEEAEQNFRQVLEYKTEEMLQAVADYRFFAGDLVKAAKWYTLLFEYCPDELDPFYYLRYAKSLESIGEITKAKRMMPLYQLKKI
jgi:tetratricopeptide (TPR) repeat protein